MLNVYWLILRRCVKFEVTPKPHSVGRSAQVFHCISCPGSPYHWPCRQKLLWKKNYKDGFSHQEIREHVVRSSSAAASAVGRCIWNEVVFLEWYWISVGYLTFGFVIVLKQELLMWQRKSLLLIDIRCKSISIWVSFSFHLVWRSEDCVISLPLQFFVLFMHLLFLNLYWYVPTNCSFL